MQDPTLYPVERHAPQHLVWRNGLNLCDRSSEGDYVTDLDAVTCQPCITAWRTRTRGACRSGTCAMGG